MKTETEVTSEIYFGTKLIALADGKLRVKGTFQGFGWVTVSFTGKGNQVIKSSRTQSV